MKTFKELMAGNEDELTEQSIAAYGDWEPTRDRLYQKSLKQLRAEWDFVEPVRIFNIVYDLYKLKNSDTFILGVKSDIGFDTIFHIELTKRPDIGSYFHYKNLVNVDGVMVHKNHRGNGIAKFMYKYLVTQKHYTILSDEIQYHKARLTWASLSKMDDMIVDIIDIEHNKIIDKNVDLYHGEADHEFDERVWSYLDIKRNIRLVLTKVL